MKKIKTVAFVPRANPIHAVQLHIGNTDQVASWCGGAVTMGGEGDHVVVPVGPGGAGGHKIAGPGDWVTTRDRGSFGVLTDAEINQRFERAS